MDNILVKYSEFFQDDGGMKKTKDDFYKLSDDLIAKAKEVRKETRIISLNDSKGIDELIGKTSQLTEVRRKYNALLRKFEALQKKTESGRKKSTKSITVETEALKRRNKEARLVAAIQSTVTGSVENMRAKLALVTVAWSKLSASELENTRRGQRLVESKKRLTAELLRLERATGDNRRQVGNYSSALGKLRGSLVSVANAAGITLGLFGAFRLVKNATSIVRDFEKQNATLAGVLQKEKSEIQELVADSQRLGSVTVKTAGEVAKLQTEYARLGFTQQEILDLTEPTINGSIALNSELSATSQLVGAIVNSYDDLSTTDAPAVIDTLALATAKSALNFEKLNVGLPIVSGAANALNVPLTEVTATLGKLADAGIETSTGATSLRNIFIESAKNGVDYRKALQEVRESTDKLSTANQLFGKRAAVSALVIANNTDGVAELDEALQNAAGTAQSMADKELDTLDGSIKLLTSAWEGLILKINGATDGGNIFSRTIRALAENLETIFKVIGIATTSYIAYVVAVKAANLATKLGIVFNRGATLTTNLKTAATAAATAAQKAFNTAVKSNPIGLIIALLAAAVTAYYAFRDSATAAEKAQKQFNDARKASFDIEVANISKEKSIQNDRLKALDAEIRLRKAQGEQGEKLDKEYIERKRQILIEEIENNQAIIESEQQKINAFKRRLKIVGQGEETAASAFQRTQAERVLQEQLGTIEGIVQARNKEIASLNKILSDIDNDLAVQIAENTKKTKKQIQDRIKELELLRRRLEDLQDGSIRNDERREIQQTKRKFDREIKAIKGNSKIEQDLRVALETEKQRQINDIRLKFQNERQVLLRRSQDIERSLIEDDDKRQIAIEKEKSNNLIAEILSNGSISIQKRLELAEQEEARFKKFELGVTNRRLLSNLENEKLISEALIEQRRGEFETEKEYEEFKQKEFIKIQRDYLTKRLNLLQSFGGDQFKVEIEQIKAQLANLDIEPPGLDKWEQFAKDLKDVLTRVGAEIEKSLQKSVEETQKSLADQQAAVDTQRARAENGLTNTLAFEQREKAKQEKELIKRQKRLDRIQKLQSYWNTYNANVSALKEGEDSGKAISKTLSDIAIIETITASLSSFGDGGIVGVDGVRTNSFGVTQGRSHNKNKGILAYHEGGEGFLSRKEMNNIGSENFYKFKQMAALGSLDTNFFSGQNESFSSSISSVNFTDPRLVNEVKSVKEAILSKPTQSLSVPEVVDGVLRFTETISSKNKVKRNHYKVKRPRI